MTVEATEDVVTKGVPEPRTISGLHDALYGEVARQLPSGSEVLDLGAGTGAWVSRLLRSGYRASAVERDVAGFALPGVTCVPADLNEHFSAHFERTFAAITAIEVIEHLENPRHFLRECRKLLSDGGKLFLTTPNIECTPARIRFLLDGSLRMFGADPRFNDPTHITPIHSFMFERMLKDTGFRLLRHTFNQPEPTVTRASARLVNALLGPLLRGSKGGDCHIFVVEKS